MQRDHEALVTPEQWDRVQAIIAGRTKRPHVANASHHLLMDMIFDDFGRKLAPRKRGTSRWPERYYESPPKVPDRPKYHDKVRVRAVDSETLVQAALVAA